MSIESSFLKSIGLQFVNGQEPTLLLTYNTDPKKGPPSLAHLSPKEYVELSYISQEKFDDYFKFAFVRNPWGRAVSLYKHFNFHRVISFTSFLKKELPNLERERYYFVKPQVEYIYDSEGNQLVDFVGRFENLQEDFEKIRNKITPLLGDLEYINKSKRKQNVYSRWNIRHINNILKKKPYLIRNFSPFYNTSRPYRELYTKEARELVDSFYQKDIELLGYEF